MLSRRVQSYRWTDLSLDYATFFGQSQGSLELGIENENWASSWVILKF